LFFSSILISCGSVGDSGNSSGSGNVGFIPNITDHLDVNGVINASLLIAFNNIGGAITSCSVSPNLPAGLI
jgi:hypothetical protein